METQNTTAAAAPLPLPGPICDREGCSNPANATYAFDWGENGICCSTHQFLLKQTADQIFRGVQFLPLANLPPAPMARDERARLKGETYALTEELEEAKGRGLELYRQNEQLMLQLQASTTRGRETELQLRDATREIERLQVELQSRDAEHGGMVDELTRLRTLAKLQPAQHVVGEGGAPAEPPTSKQGKNK